MFYKGHRTRDLNRAFHSEVRKADRERGALGSRHRPFGRKQRPIFSQFHRPIGVHHPETELVAITVIFRRVAVLGRPVYPAAVPAAHYPRRVGQDQLGVPPRQIPVGGPHQSRHSRHYRRRRAGAAEPGPVSITAQSGGDSPAVRAVVGGCAHPQVRPLGRKGVVAAMIVYTAYPRHPPIVQKTVVGGITPLLAAVPDRGDLQGSPASVPLGSGSIQGRFDRSRQFHIRYDVKWTPAVITDGNIRGRARGPWDSPAFTRPTVSVISPPGLNI